MKRSSTKHWAIQDDGELKTPTQGGLLLHQYKNYKNFKLDVPNKTVLKRRSFLFKKHFLQLYLLNFICRIYIIIIMLIFSLFGLTGLFIINILFGMYYGFGTRHYWFFELEHFLGGFFVAMFLSI